LAGFLIPAGADVSVGGHEPILPFFARGSQSSTVCIFATGEIRAVSATGDNPAQHHGYSTRTDAQNVRLPATLSAAALLGRMPIKSANLDAAREYRYSLKRTWIADADRALFVMLNPSTAERHLRRHHNPALHGFRRQVGQGRNSCRQPFRPPVHGPQGTVWPPRPHWPWERDGHLERLAGECETVVEAWGKSASSALEFQKR